MFRISHITRAHRGYTLVELLVTVGIYSLAFVAISAIFMSYTRAQSRAATAQRLLSEGNYIFEQIAREIRINELEYNCPEGNYSTTDNHYICLTTQEGYEVHIRRADAAPNHIQVCKKTNQTPCNPTLAGDWQSITPDFLTFTDLKMHVYPDVNPHDSAIDAEAFHPLIVIEATMQSGSALKRQIYDFQTAISSRAYAF